ncbi:MAG: hypothetical protein V2B18_11805 [Pseudomonadota bacterium]
MSKAMLRTVQPFVPSSATVKTLDAMNGRGVPLSWGRIQEAQRNGLHELSFRLFDAARKNQENR